MTTEPVTATDAMLRLTVLAVGIDRVASEPVILLQEATPPRRVLPIPVSHPDGRSLHRAHVERTSPPAGAHLLIDQVVAGFGRRLRLVDIVGVHEGVFYAQLVFDDGSIVSARPSDAVSLALHTGAPVRTTDALLRTASTRADRVEVGSGTVPARPGERDRPAGGTGSADGCAAGSDRAVREYAATVGTLPRSSYRIARPRHDAN